MTTLDAATQALLADLANVKPLSEGDPDINVVRKAYDEVFSAWTAPTLSPTREDWVHFESAQGVSRTLEIEPVLAEDIAATIVFIHGGGWALGTAISYAPLGRWLSAETNFRVLVPDFPQAPEMPAPAALNALSDFLCWAEERYPGKLMVAGDSAGGNLAAVLANRPPNDLDIAAQVLFYPVMDLRPVVNYPSRTAYGSGDRFLTNDAIVGAAAAYCGADDAPNSPLLSPILETDFSRTPPTCLVVPEFDPLHDECMAYGQLLRDNGVDVSIEIVPGSIHGCASFSGRLPEALSALRRAAGFLRSC
jgi:acetyl esterase